MLALFIFRSLPWPDGYTPHKRRMEFIFRNPERLVLLVNESGCDYYAKGYFLKF